MSKPTIEQVIAEVKRLAAEYPKARYRGPADSICCHYSKGTTTEGPNVLGCIFGVAFSALGIAIPAESDNEDIGSLLVELGLAEPESDPLRWCAKVQHCQDEGWEWGHCVEVANNDAPQVAA